MEYEAERDGRVQRISAVDNFFKQTKNINDGDLVLVIEAETWFQLPAELVINRFFDLLQDSNASLRRTYGTKVVGNLTEPRFVQKLLFGADKRCSSDDAGDLACAAVPYSTLPSEFSRFSIRSEISGYQYRPRWLNSGTVLGRASDVRSLYSFARARLAEDRIVSQSSSPLASIFGEQEYMREVARQNTTSSWLDWLASKVSSSSKSPNITNLHLDIVDGREYEVGIGLDYESQLVQTIQHARNDIEWLIVDDSVAVSDGREERVAYSEQLDLPLDVWRLGSPFQDYGYEEITGPLDDASWPHLPLAMNMQTMSVSPLLQADGIQEADVQPLWRNMWFPPYAQFLAQSQRETPATAAVAATSSHERFVWDTSPEMGAWTKEGRWLPWTEICGNYEEDVF